MPDRALKNFSTKFSESGVMANPLRTGRRRAGVRAKTATPAWHTASNPSSWSRSLAQKQQPCASKSLCFMRYEPCIAVNVRPLVDRSHIDSTNRPAHPAIDRAIDMAIDRGVGVRFDNCSAGYNSRLGLS